MTLFMTGHGCFREYLCKYNHDNAVNYSFCINAKHIFFYCHRFGLEHKFLATMINEGVTPDNIVSHMQPSVCGLVLCQNVVCKGDAGI